MSRHQRLTCHFNTVASTAILIFSPKKPQTHIFNRFLDSRRLRRYLDTAKHEDGEKDLESLCSMSGSQFFELSISSQVNANNLFQPPRTPSSLSNSPLLTARRLSHLSASLNTIRKRSRYESDNLSATYSTTTNEWSAIPSGPGSTANTPGNLSPAPFANTRYRLAGGLDTPTANIVASYDRNTPDHDYRTGRGWSSIGSPVSGSYFPQVPSALARESNGRGRGSIVSKAQNGWGKAVITAFGGVAGKVWEFCTAGAFRGFYAGGGQGYAMTGPSYDLHSFESEEIQNNLEGNCFSEEVITSVPSGFLKSDFIPDYMSQDLASRPSKRLHCESSPDLQASWVLIGNAPLPRGQSPSRLATRKRPPASTPFAYHRNTRKAMLSPISRPTTSQQHPASSASTRSPNIESSSARSPMKSPTRHHKIRAQEEKIPNRHESFRGDVDTVSQGSMSEEARKFKAQLRRREEKDDRELRRLNKRLTDMIREGKAALGTTVEVFDGDEDEGYAEGERSDVEMKW